VYDRRHECRLEDRGGPGKLQKVGGGHKYLMSNGLKGKRQQKDIQGSRIEDSLGDRTGEKMIFSCLVAVFPGLQKGKHGSKKRAEKWL